MNGFEPNKRRRLKFVTHHQILREDHDVIGDSSREGANQNQQHVGAKPFSSPPNMSSPRVSPSRSLETLVPTTELEEGPKYVIKSHRLASN